MSNIGQLHPLPAVQAQRISQAAPAQDANFLSLRLLNNRARVRISPSTLNLQTLPGKGDLFAIANRKGWFAAVTWNDPSTTHIVLSTLEALRSTFSTPADGEELLLTPQRTVFIPKATPNCIAFASNDERLVVGLVQGPVLVYDTSKLFSAGTDEVLPLHSFPPSMHTAPRLLLPNPGEMPDLVAILREPSDRAAGHPIDILDVREMQSVGGWRGGDTPDTTPTTISWSPKGKQLAIGLQSGDVATYSPASTTPKLVIPKPPSAAGLTLLSTIWLSNPTFYNIYGPVPLTPDAQQTHFIVMHNAKSGITTDITLNAPCLPFPGLRPPSAFSMVLRNWDPAKFLLFVGDSASSDVGLVGAVADSSKPTEELWYNLNLEEISTPNMPLDKDQNDTVLVGLAVDLTNTSPGPSDGANPPPILYAYASDGTILGWSVINSQGGPYPGMIAAGSIPTSSPAPMSAIMGPPDASMALSSNAPSGMNTPQPASPKPSIFKAPPSPFPAFGQTSAFGQQAESAFGSSSFGSKSPPAFGQTSAFGKSAAPTFGQSGFGQQSSTSAFGPSVTPSTFSKATSSAFGSTQSSSGGGFGAFASASAAPAKFGQSGFGFGATSTSPPAQTPPVTESAMDDATDGGFGGLSLGKPSESTGSPSSFGTSALFGNPPPLPLPPNNPANQLPTSFGSSAFSSPGSSFKPAAGFGAFSNLSQTQAQSQNSNTDQSVATTPSSAFGTSGFGATPKSTSAFGQSGFGQTGFVTSAFGKSTSSQSPTAAIAASSQSSSRGFGAFAQGGPVSLGSAAQQVSGSGEPTKSAFGGSGAFSTSSQPGEQAKSAFGNSGSGAFGTTQLTNNSFSMGQAVESPKSAFGGIGSSSFGISEPSKAPTTAFAQGASIRLHEQTSNRPRAQTSASSSPDGSPTPLEKNKALPALSPPEDEDSPSSDSPEAFSGFATNVSSTLGFGKSGNDGSSSFKSSTPSSGFGAFGGLQTTTSPFAKPAEGLGAFSTASKEALFSATKPAPATGFGAFGSTSQLSSAFASPKLVESAGAFGAERKPVSAFGSSAPSPAGTSASPQTASSSHMFGKSSFGSGPALTMSTPASRVPPVTPPVTGGFGAFSSGPGGFGAYANSGKTSSFSDLLRTKSEDNVSDVPKSVFGPFSDAKATTSDKSPGEIPTTDIKSEPISVASTSPHQSVYPSSSRSGTKDQHDESAEKTGKEGEASDTVKVAQEPSLGTLSLTDISASSSFVEVLPPDSGHVSDRTKTPAEDAEQDEEAEEDEQSDHGSEPPEDDAESFLSESFSENSDSEAEEHEELGSENSQSPSPEDPAKKPLPPTPPVTDSRRPSESPSTTPTPQIPSIRLASPGFGPPVTKTSLSFPNDTPKEVSPPPKIQISTTTPPGSPAKQRSESPPFQMPLTAPIPVPAATSPSSPSAPFSFGLGRPTTTRPARSSPLASAPLSGDDDDDEKTGTHPMAKPEPSPVPRPAPHKVPFGQWTPSSKPTPVEETQSPVLEKSRPKTPPLLTTFGPSSPSTVFSMPPIFTPPPFKLPTSPAPQPPVFSPLFGSKSPATPVMPPSSVVPPQLSFGSPLTLMPPGQNAVAPQQTPPLVEQGMQAECANLFMSLARELEALRRLAQEASKRREELSKPSPSSHTKADLGDTFKWSLGDAKLFGQVMKTLENDIADVRSQHLAAVRALREAESSLLKAGTRKEEIVRFSKARTDTEFAKMLKVRTLGPEHLETQNQLRRDIRIIRDRVQKLEDHLQASKKKLEEARTGKPSFKVPSLDTINRTFRNIDAALAFQSDTVSQLSARVSKMDLKSALRNPSLPPSACRDKRLPDDVLARRPLNVTPDVASTTAAALNAERAAAKLKRVLLSVRKQPLLNTGAADVVPARTSFQTPVKASALASGSGLSKTGLETESLPGWALPDVNVGQDLHTLETRQRGGSGSKRHGKAVPLKRSAGNPSTSPTLATPTASFDWGPLPGVKPLKTLSADVRPKGTGLGSPSGSAGLSESWVSEGFESAR